MCLSTVYKGSEPGADNVLAEYVTNIEVADGSILLTDITGEELTFRGALRHIDLINGKIYVAPAEA
jgi:predicted RNA-binding protein